MGFFTKRVFVLLLGLACFEPVSASARSHICGETRLSILKSELAYDWSLPGFPSFAQFSTNFPDSRMSDYDSIKAENIILGNPSDQVYLDGNWTFIIRRDSCYQPYTTLALSFTRTPQPHNPICEQDPFNLICSMLSSSSAYDPVTGTYTQSPVIQITLQPLVVIDHAGFEYQAPSLAPQKVDSNSLDVGEIQWHLDSDTYERILASLEDSLVFVFQIRLIQAAPLPPTEEVPCSTYIPLPPPAPAPAPYGVTEIP